MYAEGSSSANPTAVLAVDPDRADGFEKRGQVLAINPVAYKIWQERGQDTWEDSDLLQKATYKYRDYGAKPASEINDDTTPTPVDFLFGNPQSALLQGVSATCIY